MTLTWRQIEAYVGLNEKLDSIDRTFDLLIAVTGSQGDQQAIEKTVKQLTVS